IPGVTGERLAEALRARGQETEFVKTLPDLRQAVRAAMLPGDLVLFLGAGDITHAAHALAAELGEESMTPTENLCAELTARLSNEAVIKRDEPLAKRTTL